MTRRPDSGGGDPLKSAHSARTRKPANSSVFSLNGRASQPRSGAALIFIIGSYGRPQFRLADAPAEADASSKAVSSEPLARRTLRVGTARGCLPFQNVLALGERLAVLSFRAAPVLTNSTVESSRNAIRKYQNTIQFPYLPRPPKPPAAPLKRPYRKRRSSPHRTFLRGAFPIGV